MKKKDSKDGNYHNGKADKSSVEIVDDVVKLTFFSDLVRDIAASRTINEIMNHVMDKIGTIFVPLNWSLLLKKRKTGQLYFRVVVGVHADKLRGKVVPKGKGIANWIAETGQSVIVEDVSKDSRFNDYFDRITGFKTKSIIGVPLANNGRVFGVIELINKLNGESFTPLELKILTTIADFAAIAIGKVYYFRALKKIATIDPLTGISNRRIFEKIFSREAARCKRYGGQLSMIMIDINDFKKINDQFGHPAGDKVLKNLARILRRSVRKVDTVARYGGDEFVVLMPNTPREKAEVVRKRIEEHLTNLNMMGEELPFRISMGLHSASGDAVDELIIDADMDLYRQKSKKEDENYENLGDYLEDFMNEEE